jgi:murein tripeptide amidase MpaA
MEEEFNFLSSVLTVVFQLLNPPAHDEEIENMLDAFEWVFSPVLNVDGFSFTHEVSSCMNIKRLCNDVMKM